MISIKTEEEIEIMREGGRILALIFDELIQVVKPNVSADVLNQVAESLIKKYNVVSAFKGYVPDYQDERQKEGYPAVLCVSLNSEIVHGLPIAEKKIRDRDLVSLDMGIKYQGFFLDKAITIGVGEISIQAKKLIEITKKALDLAIEKIKPGVHLGDISATIQNFVEENGFSVVRDLTGHGIGRKLHEDPVIFNYGEFGTGPILKSGMVLAIEPMVNIGDHEIKTQPDGWTIVTADGSLSAHFEDTVAVIGGKSKILTRLE